jgi:hypothetical protein
LKKKKPLGDIVNFLCNPVLIWRPTGGGLQNLANPVQNPKFFWRVFSKFSKKKTFVLVAVPKLISHFGKVSHPNKTLLCTWKLQYSVLGGGGGLEGAGPILCYSQSGDNPQEDLAKFDY